MRWFYLPITAVVIVAIFAIVSYANKADARVFKIDYVEASINLKTKGAIGEVGFKLVDYVTLKVATDETLTTGVDLTDILKIGHESVDVYFERTHFLREKNFFSNADNVVGVRVKF